MRDMNTLIYSVYAEELRSNTAFFIPFSKFIFGVEQDQKFKGLRILDTYPGSGMSVFRLLAEMKPEDIHKITVADEYGAFSALSKENLTINRISTKTPRLEGITLMISTFFISSKTHSLKKERQCNNV